MRRQAYLGHMLLLEVLLMLAALPFFEEVCYVFVAGVWEAELLVARAPAGYIVLAKMMRLISIALSILSIPLFLLFYSFAGALGPLPMFLRESGIKGLLSLGGMLFWNFGMLYVVMVRVVLFPHFIPVILGFFRISMAFSSGCLIPLRC